jgi:hypothetical protein
MQLPSNLGWSIGGTQMFSSQEPVESSRTDRDGTFGWSGPSLGALPQQYPVRSYSRGPPRLLASCSGERYARAPEAPREWEE